VRTAFSLIELIIVVMIMGVVYTLSINNFQNIKDAKIQITLKNLKKSLQNIEHSDSVELICLNKCQSCKVYVDGALHVEDNRYDEFLDDSVEVYRYDFSYGFMEAKRKVFFNEDDVEKDVCLSLMLDKKGVSDQVAVLFKNKVYDFSSYIDDTKTYASLQELSDAKSTLTQEVIK